MFFVSKPKFITNIVMESPKKFKHSVKGYNEVAEFPNYRVCDGVISKKSKVTYNANTCSILAMSNGEETYLGHYAPEIRKSDFIDKLDYIIKKFQDATGRLSAFVTGGHDYKITNPAFKSKESYEQLVDIGNLLEKNNVDSLTIIGGKKTPVFNDNLGISNDKFLFSQISHRINNPLDITKNPPQTELEAILDSQYSICEIDPKHTIRYVG